VTQNGHKHPAFATLEVALHNATIRTIKSPKNNQEPQKHSNESMIPTRKPKIGIQRPSDKPSGKPLEKPTAKPLMYPTAFDGAKKQPPEEALKNVNKKQPPDEEAWKNVNPRHSTRSDTQKKDIERIMPQLEELIQKQKAEIPHSQIDKFRELQK
jgi:hypothetical protein